MKACCLETYNEGYNRGLEYKEQEIIKLLEVHKMTYLADDVMYCCEGRFEHAIALIKEAK